MKTTIFVKLTVLAIVFGCFISLAPAQQVAIKSPVNLKEITGLTDYEVDTPTFAHQNGKKKKWGVFSATFDALPKWTPQLSATYYVFFERQQQLVEGDKRYAFVTVTCNYADIEQGRDRKIGAVIPPNALKRLGKPLGICVQLSVGDKVVAQKSEETGILKKYPKWWENPQVIDTSVNKFLDKPSGQLLDRAKTVFAYVDMDSYEESK